MKILYIHQYFRTPKEGWSTRSYELARGLVEHGHEVCMITTHNKLSGPRMIDGIEVHYLKIPYENHFGFLKRVFAFLKFVRLAKKEARKIGGIEKAYVMTTPLTTGLIALYLKKRFSVPYLFEVGDLWPEAPVQMGVIRNRWLTKKLYAFEKKCYDEAEKVVALSPAIENYIRKISATETIKIPNLSDCEFFSPAENDNEIFQIGYFGTFGVANDLGQVIALARYVHQLSLPVHFTLMGNGAESQKLKQAAKDLDNVTVLPFGNKERVKEVMDRMDAIYISYKNIPVLNTGSPNKLFDGLAAGKLIIINFKGWINDLIESNQCGFAHDPVQPQSFVDQVMPFLKSKKLLASYQQNSRKLAETQFEKKILIETLVATLKE
ncbi:MAG: glycosyltransferase family 4 protein [Cyclobacteriaceae bacterium]